MVILLFSVFGLKSFSLGGLESILLKFCIYLFLASVIDFRRFLLLLMFVLLFLFLVRKE